MRDNPVILVVDDQPAVRRLVEAILQAAGYRVIAAAHGSEALTLAQGQPLSLAVLDLYMPGLDGLQTLQGLRSLQPGLPAVLMTARAEAVAADRPGTAGVFLIAKPFDVAAFRRLVAAALQKE